jgi:hypothetical protein
MAAAPFGPVVVYGAHTAEGERSAAVWTTPPSTISTAESDLTIGPGVDVVENLALESAGANSLQREEELRDRLLHLGLSDTDVSAKFAHARTYMTTVTVRG